MYPQAESLATHGRAMYFRNGETVGFGKPDCLAALSSTGAVHCCLFSVQKRKRAQPRCGLIRSSENADQPSVSSSSSFEYLVASSTLGSSLGQPSSPILEGPSSSGRRTLGWSENRGTSPEKSNRDDGGNVTLLSEPYSQPFERMTLTEPYQTRVAQSAQ
jgi:hypothetical protein